MGNLSGRAARLLMLLALLAASALVAPPAYADVPIQVTATGPAGEPLDGTLWFYAEGSGNAQGVGINGGHYAGTTNRVGRFQIAVQSSTMDGASRWYVEGDPDGTDDRTQATVVTFPDVGSLAFALTFPDQARVVGTVTDGTGAPAPGIRTYVTRNSSSRAGPISAADGTFDLGYLRPGNAAIYTSETDTAFGTRVEITVPTTGTLDVDLQLEPGGRIAGTLVDSGSGEPLPHVRVSVHRGPSADQDWSVAEVLTDTTGAFTFPKVHADDTLLRFSDPMGVLPTRWSGDTAGPGTAEVLAVTVGETTSYDAAITPGPDPRTAPHTLTGVVTGPDRQPLRGITVTAVPTGSGTALTTSSDHGGRWAIDAPDGSYRVQYDAGSGWYDLQLPIWQREQWPDRWAGTGTPVTVADGVGRDDLDESLHLAGRVGFSAHGPGGTEDVVAGLTLVDAAGRWHEVLAPGESWSRPTWVKPGTYRALLTGDALDGSPLVSRWYGGDGRRRATATVVTVPPQGSVDLPTQELGASLTPTAPPAVGGSPRAGRRLTVTSPGTFPLVDGAPLTYRWQRGTTVVGAGPSYVVTPADLGRRLTLAVTATHRGLSGTGRTTIDVPRAATAITGQARATGDVTRLRLRVRAAGAVPRGTVLVSRAGEVVARGRLRDGRLRLVLRDQPRRASYTMRYRGTPAFAPARTVVRPAERARNTGRP